MSLLLFFVLNGINLQLKLSSSPIFSFEEAYDVREVVACDNFFVVLRRHSPYISTYHLDGSEKKSWGTQGQAPNEFTLIQSVAVAENEVWVLNKQPAKLSKFDPAGLFKSSMLLRELTHPVKIRYENNQGFIQDKGMADPGNNDLISINQEDYLVTKLDLGKTVRLSGSKHSKGPTFTVKSPYAGQDLWVIDGEGHLVIIRGNQFSISFFKKSSLHHSWAIEKKLYPVTDNGMQLWFDNNFPKTPAMGLPIDMWRKQAENINRPNNYPSAITMIADGVNIWIQRSIGAHVQTWEKYKDNKKVGILEVDYRVTVFEIKNNVIYLAMPEGLEERLRGYTIL